MARLGPAGLLEQVADRALALVAGVVLAAAPGERLVEDVDHALAGGAGRVERAAFDQRLERALVDDLRVDPLGEVPDRLERPALRAGGDDRTARALADVLDRVHAEADLPLDDGEVDRGH